MVAFPPFRLDSDQERLWKGDTQLNLRRKPFAILRYLVQHPKKLVTQEELLAKVWGGSVVSDSAMRSHMHELRQVLGEGVIETVIGRGYRFVATLCDEALETEGRGAGDVDPLVVGREQELAALNQAFARARAGQRQLCFVTGPPGIGKTTLVRTFLAGVAPNHASVISGSCFEQHAAPEPYFAIIEALTTLARSARGAEAVAALVRYAPTFVAQVQNLVTDEQLHEATRRAAGGNESRQLRELCDALEAMCAKEPLVLVLEDLQWSDLATIDLLSMLGQRSERAKLFLLCTSRHAEVQHPNHPLYPVMRSLVARSRAFSIRVPQVDSTALQCFIDRRFPEHDFPRELTASVASITDGIPLFMVSLLEELAGRGILAEQSGGWRLTVSIDDVLAHRPASVKQLIDVQLDRLTAMEQRVLEAASVVGAEFSPTLVAAALELSIEQVDDTCDALVRRSLFLRAEPEGRYAVTHALIQEVCSERSSPARRQRWHRLVAEAMQCDAPADEVSHLLAMHFDAAGDASRAVTAYAAAARQAARRYATSDTLSLCARALSLLTRLQPGRERDALEFQLLRTSCQQVNSNSFRSSFAGREPSQVYARAIEIARSLGDASSVYDAITQLCNYNMIIARYEDSSDLYAELRRIEQAHELDAALLHAGVFSRAYSAFYTGELSQALELLDRLVPAPEQASVFQHDLAGRTVALGHLACLRWILGEPERALEEAAATIELAERVEVPVLVALGHVVRLRLLFLRRDPLEVIEKEALPALNAASVDLGLHTEARAFALWVSARRAPLALSEIEPLLDAFAQRLTEVSTGSTWVAQVLIDVLRLSGHTELALRLTDEIIEFALSHGERVYLPELWRMRAEQLASTDSSAAALDLHKAIELSRAMGARIQEERARLGLDQLQQKPKPPTRVRKGARSAPSRRR